MLVEVLVEEAFFGPIYRRAPDSRIVLTRRRIFVALDLRMGSLASIQNVRMHTYKKSGLPAVAWIATAPNVALDSMQPTAFAPTTRGFNLILDYDFLSR